MLGEFRVILQRLLDRDNKVAGQVRNPRHWRQSVGVRSAARRGSGAGENVPASPAVVTEPMVASDGPRERGERQ